MTDPWAPWQTTVWHRQQQYAAHTAHETRSDAVTPAVEAIAADVGRFLLPNSAPLASANGASFSEEAA